MSAAPHPTTGTSRLKAFSAGFLSPWRGFVFMWQEPGLWQYGIAPVLLNLIITGLMLLLLVFAMIFAVASAHGWFDRNDYSIFWEILAICGLIVLTLGLVLATWKLLEGILCGHFYGKLAREVELRIGTPEEELRDVPFRLQVVDSVTNFVTLTVINLGFLTLNCLPVVGSIAAISGALYLDSLILGRDYLQFPTQLRGMRRHEIRVFTRLYRYHTLGLGAAVLVFSLIPIVGAVLLTTAVTGTVLLHQRITDEGRTIGPTPEALNA